MRRVPAAAARNTKCAVSARSPPGRPTHSMNGASHAVREKPSRGSPSLRVADLQGRVRTRFRAFLDASFRARSEEERAKVFERQEAEAGMITFVLFDTPAAFGATIAEQFLAQHGKQLARAAVRLYSAPGGNAHGVAADRCRSARRRSCLYRSLDERACPNSREASHPDREGKDGYRCAAFRGAGRCDGIRRCGLRVFGKRRTQSARRLARCVAG